MCEILIRVHDSHLTGDPIEDCKASRRGDVIVVCPDGWGWGKEELTNPFWRILKLPNVSVSEASVFEAHEVSDEPAPRRTLQFRMNSFDLEHSSFTRGMQNYLADDTRKTAAYSVSVAALDDLVKRKPVIPDPAGL